MHWIDEGLVLSAQKYGESSLILHAVTRDHGRYAGLVRGGTGKRLRGILQPGNEVGLRWHGRLSEQLGTFTVEAKSSIGTFLFDQPLSLAASSSALSLLEKVMPEREPHPALFEATVLLIKNLAKDFEIWGPLFVRWELGLLSELGYGLDLSECAATGAKDNLIYVSPKSGRAVSEAAGAEYHNRLLKLPAFLQIPNADQRGINSLYQQVSDGLELTGSFLDKSLLSHYRQNVLPARERFLNAFRQKYLNLDNS